jgi:zinc/manganese transport system substrate-binding protein
MDFTKTTAPLVGACLLSLSAWGSGQPARAGEQLTVVTTTSDLKSLAEAVGGTHVKVTSLNTGLDDPHFLSAKPSYMMTARKADLWIRIGLELEIGYEGLVIEGSRNKKIKVGEDGHLDASVGITRLEVPTGKVDRSMGDVHPEGNPHYWLDPYHGRIIARTICDRLKKLDPADADDYEKNCLAFQKKLDEAAFGQELVAKLGGEVLWPEEVAGKLDAALKEKGLTEKLGGWIGQMRPYRGTKIITYHRSWGYFTTRFGLEVIEELEPKPGIPPSPAHLIEVIETCKKDGAKLILAEPFYERKGPDFVASKANLKVVMAANSVGGQKEASDYIAMINNVVKQVSAALAEAGK